MNKTSHREEINNVNHVQSKYVTTQYCSNLILVTQKYIAITLFLF
jgi:hypothetical protein